jgi:flagellar basal body-associated protein FliL
MSQPPDDPFYNAPTENINYARQQGPPNYPSGPSQQGPANYPGGPSQQGFNNYPGPSQQGPANYPGGPSQQGPANYPGGPSQQGPANYPGGPSQQGPANYPGGPLQQGANNNPGPPPGGYPLQAQNLPPIWPSTAQQQSGGPKKSRKGLIAIISIVLVLLIAIGGATAYLTLFHKNAAQATATPTVQSSNPGSTGIIPTLPANATIPVPGGAVPGGVHTVGQPVQAGSNWLVTITHTDTTSTSALPPKAGDTYVEISMTLKNVSATSQVISSLLQFSLTGTNAAKYTESITDTNIHQTPDGTIKARTTLNAAIAFEVPQSAHAFILTFNYGLIQGNPALVNWAFTA